MAGRRARQTGCILATGCNHLDDGLDVVVEGEAMQVTDGARLGVLADAWEEKYGSDWRFTGSVEVPDSHRRRG